MWSELNSKREINDMKKKLLGYNFLIFLLFKISSHSVNDENYI